MKLSGIRTFALAVLLAMNLFFLFALLGRGHAASTYSDELVNAAVESYGKSDLYVSKQFLKKKIPSFPVYTGETPLASPEKLQERMSLSDFSVAQEPSGIRFTRGTEEFTFGNDFAFSYTKDGEKESPSTLLATGIYPLQSHAKVRDSLNAVVLAFLDAYQIRSAVEKAGYGFMLTACYGSGGDYIVCYTETLDGLETSCKVYFRIQAGELLSADGNLALLSPLRKMTAEHTGPMPILFAEKDKLDLLYQKKGVAAREQKVLTRMSYSYAFYFDTDGSFYFVPILTLSYRDGTASRYNYVNGKEYIG